MLDVQRARDQSTQDRMHINESRNQLVINTIWLLQCKRIFVFNSLLFEVALICFMIIWQVRFEDFAKRRNAIPRASLNSQILSKQFPTFIRLSLIFFETNCLRMRSTIIMVSALIAEI